MNLYALPPIISVVPFLILGLTNLLLNPEDRTNRLLSAACFGYALLVSAMGLLHLSTNESPGIFLESLALLFPDALALDSTGIWI